MVKTTNLFLCVVAISLRNKVFWVAELYVYPMTVLIKELIHAAGSSWCLSKPYNSLPKHWISLGGTVANATANTLVKQLHVLSSLTNSWDISGYIDGCVAGLTGIQLPDILEGYSSISNPIAINYCILISTQVKQTSTCIATLSWNARKCNWTGGLGCLDCML